LASLSGPAANSLKPRYQSFAPAIEVFLKEHLFADVFMRDVLDYRSREIATVGVLSNLPGANAQLRSHIGLAMNQGLTGEQMKHLFTVMSSYIGKERGDNALGVLKEVMSEK
jgi:alkylhydroperoxidase/carboxymuconolactone decarboxylase family protein YurZ